MKAADAKQMIEPFMDRCDGDRDRYMISHVSTIEDYGSFFCNNMDMGDALVVIKELYKRFGFNAEVLKMTLTEDQNQ
jgi:hypothetical protein